MAHSVFSKPRHLKSNLKSAYLWFMSAPGADGNANTQRPSPSPLASRSLCYRVDGCNGGCHLRHIRGVLCTKKQQQT